MILSFAADALADDAFLIAAISCTTFLCLRVWCALALRFAASAASAAAPSLPSSSDALALGALGVHEKDEIAAKTVSTVHAIVATLASACVLALDAPAGFPNRAAFASPRTIALVSFSCGYFFYDFIWAIFDIFADVRALFVLDAETRRKLPYLAHHLACFLVYSQCLQRRFHLLYVCAFLFWEVSTPFLNLRWMLLKFSSHTDPAAKALRRTVDMAFALSFIVVRVVLGNYVTFRLWRDLLPLLALPSADLVFLYSMLACSLVLSSLNALWCWQIIAAVVGGKRILTKQH